MKDLDGKNIVITGGSYGLGLEIARAFLKEGANVFTIARNKEKLDVAVEDLGRDVRRGRRVEGYPCDVTDREGITATIDTIAAEKGGIDALINNAGIVIPGYFEKVTVDDFETVLRTNYLGAVYSIKAALPHLLEHPESAVTVTSSVLGYKGIFGYGTYSPTKFALIGLAEVMRAELKDRGVQVTVLCPPDTDTPGLAEERKTRPRETEAIAGTGWLADPADVAAKFMKGFKKGKFMVIAGLAINALYRINGISPRFADYVFDSMVKKERSKRA